MVIEWNIIKDERNTQLLFKFQVIKKKELCKNYCEMEYYNL